MTKPIEREEPSAEQIAERVRLMAELRVAVDQAKIRLRSPRLEAVLGDGIIIAETRISAKGTLKLTYIYSAFDSNEEQEAIDYVKSLR